MPFEAKHDWPDLLTRWAENAGKPATHRLTLQAWCVAAGVPLSTFKKKLAKVRGANRLVSSLPVPDDLAAMGTLPPVTPPPNALLNADTQAGTGEEALAKLEAFRVEAVQSLINMARDPDTPATAKLKALSEVLTKGGMPTADTVTVRNPYHGMPTHAIARKLKAVLYPTELKEASIGGMEASSDHADQNNLEGVPVLEERSEDENGPESGSDPSRSVSSNTDTQTQEEAV